MAAKTKNTITYEEFKNQLEKDSLSPVYIISGNDEYLIEQTIQDIRKKAEVKHPGAEYISFYCDSTGMREILDNARSLGLFSSKKILVIKNCEMLQKADGDQLADYISSPGDGCYLIAVFENLKKFKFKPGETIISVNIPSNSKNLILKVKKEAEKQGYKIKNDAIQRLIELVGENLIDLIGEIKKLAISQSGEKIEKSDVESHINKTKFKDVFELINAICDKDRKKAYAILTDLEQNDEEPIAVLNRIAWKIRQLWQVHDLTEEKNSKEQIAKSLRMSPGSLYYAQKQIKNFKIEEYREILEVIYETDLKLKSTQTPRYDLLTSCVMQVCRS